MHVHTCKLYPTYNQSKCSCMHDNSEVKVTLINLHHVWFVLNLATLVIQLFLPRKIIA
jgi:hypothetical protein